MGPLWPWPILSGNFNFIMVTKLCNGYFCIDINTLNLLCMASFSINVPCEIYLLQKTMYVIVLLLRYNLHIPLGWNNLFSIYLFNLYYKLVYCITLNSFIIECNNHFMGWYSPFLCEYYIYIFMKLYLKFFFYPYHFMITEEVLLFTFLL